MTPTAIPRNSPLIRLVFDMTERARGYTDHDLLSLYIRSGNDLCFESLVRRHGASQIGCGSNAEVEAIATRVRRAGKLGFIISPNSS